MKELKPTVFIVHNDAEVVRGLRVLMESVRLSVEIYPGVRGLLQSFDLSRPGCLILDARMPEISGIELCRRLRKGGSTLPAIFVTAHGDVPTAVQAMQEGAFDFLQHPFSEQYLLDRVHAAIEKDGCDRRRAAEQKALVARFADLSPKERQVMHLIVDGMSSKAMAGELGIGIKTVDFHKANIMRKVGVETIVELVYLFIKGGGDQAMLGKGPWAQRAKAGGDSDGAREPCGRSMVQREDGPAFRECGPEEGAAGAATRLSSVLCRCAEAAVRASAPARAEGA